MQNRGLFFGAFTVFFKFQVNSSSDKCERNVFMTLSTQFLYTSILEHVIIFIQVLAFVVSFPYSSFNENLKNVMKI